MQVREEEPIRQQSQNTTNGCVLWLLTNWSFFTYLHLDSTTGMTHLKIMNASWGRIQKYENLKRKLYKCNANIYFNQQCLRKQLTPVYTHIKAPNTSPAHIHTQRKIPTIRIKDEIKHLHAKKQKLNQQLYYLHLELANTWKYTWPIILENIEDKLHKEMSKKYKAISCVLWLLTNWFFFTYLHVWVKWVSVLIPSAAVIFTGLHF